LHLKKALESLPRQKLITYRGIPTQGKLLLNVQIGHRFYWPTFTSTSTNREAALGFAGYNGVFMKLKIKSGKKISEYSCYPNEDEVLLLPDICFVVKDVYHNGCIKVVELKEVCNCQPQHAIPNVQVCTNSYLRMVQNLVEKIIAVLICFCY